VRRSFIALIGASALLLSSLVGGAAAQPRPIIQETLLAGEPFAPGTMATVQADCNPDGNSTIDFSGSGIALGDYPGTFLEEGTLTLGPHVGPTNPVVGTEFASADAIDLTARFTIMSGETIITGTKRFAAPLAPGHSFCLDVLNQNILDLISASGTFAVGLALCTYEVTIHDPTGIFRASGNCDISVEEIHLQGTSAGRPASLDAEGFVQHLLASTPPVPVVTPGYATGGGQIAHVPPGSDGAVTFGFSAFSSERGIEGHCNVVDADTHIVCSDATSYTQVGNNATFSGNATVNGVETTYRIDVQDNAESGIGADTFSIVTGSGYSASGVLTQGDVQVHEAHG
jgi:hypothetical protein